MKSSKTMRKKLSLFIPMLTVFFTLSALFTNCSQVNFSSRSLSDLEPSEASIPMNCMFNGSVVLNGESVQAFLNSSGSCQSETRTCQDGQLSGSYNYATCSENVPSSCLFDGRTIAHGETVEAYLSSSVPYGQTCQKQGRSCDNGTLSGSYEFASCNPGAPASCSFNGQSIPHGGSVVAYNESSVPFGQSCVGVTRSCDNGSLSGAAPYGSCVVDQPASCLFDGKTVPHGGNVIAYDNSSVPFGQSCTGVTRSCHNGSLSGSVPYGSCVVDQPASCLFNGKTVPHGGSVMAYLSARADSCSGQTRTCNNGSLSGSAQYTSCTPISYRWVTYKNDPGFITNFRYPAYTGQVCNSSTGSQGYSIYYRAPGTICTKEMAAPYQACQDRCQHYPGTYYYVGDPMPQCELYYRCEAY